MKEKLIYIGILVPIMLLVLLLQFYKVDPFESFSLRFNDINFQLQEKEPSKEIVFVAVDEPSVNKFGRWPWDRKIIAKGIKQLDQADIVLMDMIFSEATSGEQDTALSDAISTLNMSVCGFFLRHSSTQTIGSDTLDILSDSALDLLQSQVLEHNKPRFIQARYAEMNILPILESCTLSASFSTLAENDNLMRSYPISVYYEGMLFPSLGIQALRLKYNKDIQRVDDNHVSINEKIIDLDSKGFVRLNYYKQDQYNIISFLDVIEQKVKPEYFKDKLVILGVTEVGAGDIVSTPVGAFYGPLLHYTFISNLLQNHLIKEPKYTSALLIIFMALLPFILVLVIKKILHRAITYLVIYMTVYWVVRYLFISNMIYIDLFYPLISLLITGAAIEVVAFNIQEQSGRFIRNAFSSYLSSDLLDQLIENPEALSLGGESKELSILFSDIRGFTTISESMSPVNLIKLLNRYFAPMTNSVIANKGMLDKYIGDAVMAFFNAPVDVKEHADAACMSALEMIEKLHELNIELESDGIAPIRIGIGINTAEVVVGNMGSDTRFNYTVIGDGVNLAARVESLTKNYGVDILITEFTVAKLKKDFLYRKLEPVAVKGKSEPVLLYELMAVSDRSKEIQKLYNIALDSYMNKNVDEARRLFSELSDKYNDITSEYFLSKIQKNIPWGILKMTLK